MVRLASMTDDPDGSHFTSLADTASQFA